VQERTHEGRSIGGRALTATVRTSHTFPRGRVCRADDCGTELSIYNDGHYCSLHLPRAVPHLRGRRAA
jgi:hypothetical protein